MTQSNSVGAPVVMIAGATGGIGRALAHEYASQGYRLRLLGRNAEALESLCQELRSGRTGIDATFHPCNFLVKAEVQTAFKNAVSTLDSLDLVIYAAGVMHKSAQEVDNSSDEDTFGVNVLGAISTLEIAAAYMEKAGRGRLAAIGSIAGERGRRGNPVYCASKSALHSYLEGLRNRLHPLGIGVSTIKPGFVNTRMLGGDHYPGAIEPEVAARTISRALARGKDSFFVPWWWSLVSFSLRVCPAVIFKRFGPA